MTETTIPFIITYDSECVNRICKNIVKISRQNEKEEETKNTISRPISIETNERTNAAANYENAECIRAHESMREQDRNMIIITSDELYVTHVGCTIHSYKHQPTVIHEIKSLNSYS